VIYTRALVAACGCMWSLFALLVYDKMTYDRLIWRDRINAQGLSWWSRAHKGTLYKIMCSFFTHSTWQRHTRRLSSSRLWAANGPLNYWRWIKKNCKLCTHRDIIRRSCFLWSKTVRSLWKLLWCLHQSNENPSETIDARLALVHSWNFHQLFFLYLSRIILFHLALINN
jgi:hypothetical protein